MCSSSSSTRITVKSMLICYQTRLSLHACTNSCITLYTVPQPTVNITPNRTGVLYAGTPLTLTCSIQLNPAVDTTVMVTRTWSGPGSQAVSISSRVTVSNLVKRSENLYETTIEFGPLTTTDTGDYECEATVAPDPQSQFVIMSTAGSDMHSVTVQGEISCLISDLCTLWCLGEEVVCKVFFALVMSVIFSVSTDEQTYRTAGVGGG